MVIWDPYGMPLHAVVVFGPVQSLTFFFKSILCILCQQSVVRRFEQNHEESWIDAQNEKYFHISRVRRCVEFSLFKHETFNLFLQS